MKKTGCKVLSLLCAVVMMACAVPTAVFAEMGCDVPWTKSQTLLEEMELPCRRQLIDDVFSVGQELGVETLAELVAEGRRRQSFKAISAKLTGIDRDTRDCFLRALRSVFREEDTNEPEA